MKLDSNKNYLIDADISLNNQVKQVFSCQNSTIVKMLQHVSLLVSTQMAWFLVGH